MSDLKSMTGSTGPASTDTCKDWIPASMKSASPPGDVDLDTRKAAYQTQRKRQRRIFRRWLLALGILWAAGFALTVGVNEDAARFGVGMVIILFTPLAMLLAWAIYYQVRRSTEIEMFEDDFNPGADPFPSGRLVTPESRTVYVLTSLMICTLAGGFPWAIVGTEVDRGELRWTGGLQLLTVLLCALALAAAGVWLWRWQGEGVSEVPGGLRLRTLTKTRVVPWDDVTGIGVSSMVVSTKYSSSTIALLFIRTKQGVVADTGTSLPTGTKKERARTRHNIRVAARWVADHHLPEDPGLKTAIRYVKGEIEVDELVAGADPESVLKSG